MAEGGGKDNKNNDNFKNNTKSNEDDNSSGDENVQDRPDIGLGNNGHHTRKSATETGHAGSSTSAGDLPRNDNPFSFKHFLNQVASGGARPKVYSNNSSTNPRIITNPELASGLPDFVQDHLVVEQCFLNQNPPSPAVGINDLSDFGGQNSGWGNGNGQREDHLPFDLMPSRHEQQNEQPRMPLDLPEAFPFDLPCKPPTIGDVGGSSSLPDFLSDGPIHSGRRPDNVSSPSDTNSPNLSSHHSQLMMLHAENAVLKRTQEGLRRQLSDVMRKNEMLEGELRCLRNRDMEDVTGLENVIRQVEDNLAQTIKRATAAELKVTKLKQEIKLLKMERDSQGACGPSTSRDRMDDQRLASGLRVAVTSAEQALRQMLSGVDTLRSIASTLENRHYFDSNADSEHEHDDDTGPAL